MNPQCHVGGGKLVLGLFFGQTTRQTGGELSAAGLEHMVCFVIFYTDAVGSICP